MKKSQRLLVWCVVGVVGAAMLAIGIHLSRRSQPSGTSENENPVRVAHVERTPARDVAKPIDKIAKPAAELQQSAPVVAPAAPDQIADAVTNRLAALLAAGLGSQKMADELERLGRKSDDISIGMLLALSNDREWGAQAIRALGGTRTSAARIRVADALRKKLTAADVETVCVAAETYAQVAKNEATPDLQAMIGQNWMRPDGRGQQVCAAAVRGLGSINTPASEQALLDQLARVNEPGWLPDYGSSVVAALANMPQGSVNLQASARRLSPEVTTALDAYAAALEQRMPGPDNPPGRKYIEEKIAEARTAKEGVPARRTNPSLTSP